MKPYLTAHSPLIVEFYDLDPMNIVWHGNYMRYFEKARSDLLDLVNFNYLQMRDSGYKWPIVDMRIKYVRPLELKQKVTIEAGLIEYENRLKIDYSIFDEKTGDVYTKATSIQVAVKEGSNELEFECPQEFVKCVEKVIK